MGGGFSLIPEETPSHRGCCGYADLLRASRGDPARMAAVADMLGYRRTERPSPPPPPLPPDDPAVMPVAEAPSKPESVRQTPIVTSAPLAAAPLWRLTGNTVRKAVTREPVPEIPQPRWVEATVTPPLAAWPALLPRVRNGFARLAESRAVDVDAMIRRVEMGRMLDRPPRRRRRRWGGGIQIIVDRSDRLVPFFHDQNLVAGRLARLFPHQAVGYALARDGLAEPLLFDPRHRGVGYRPPDPGTLVVVLGDLGCLAGQPGPVAARWAALGRRLVAAGCRPVALTPAPRSRWAAPALEAWKLVEWDRRPAAPARDRDLRKRAERLLRLLSPAIRIEPGLLREIRLLLGDAADAGTEADAWQHPWLTGRSSVAGTLDVATAMTLRAELAVAPGDKELRSMIAKAMRRYRAALPPEIWAEELLRFDPAVLPQDIRAVDLPWAFQIMAGVARDLGEHPGDPAWNRRRYGRNSSECYRHDDPALQAALRVLDAAARPEDPDQSRRSGPGFDPIKVPGGKEHTLELWRRGPLLALSSPGTTGQGGPLATLRTANGWVAINENDAFWESGAPPPWAEEWGRDEYGAWVTFTVNGVTQRMRWIPPGRFMMGSPEDDNQAYDDEKPRHLVTISRGFWLFDTACTQELFEAVMKSGDPKRHKHPKHPVVDISWHTIQEKFLKQLNEAVHGLDLGLPTEAQWEYACRAGTTTPFSFGETISSHLVNYGGKEIVDVGTLPPNPWGLYEMHGNVWEWCADGHRDYGTEPEIDPHGPLETGAARATCGGSWNNGTLRARAASRYWPRPDARLKDLGFRCARVQVSPAGEGGAEPADPASGWQAERHPPQGPTSGAGDGTLSLLRLDQGEAAAQCPMPRTPSFQVRTDCARLTFSRITQSDCDWADRLGRDQFGLWAEIAVGDVRQRLRWIPPGQFLMGSPDDEPGRLDREGPQHTVTLSQGYWLFDTPCTQGLWQAVMGNNPSRFQSSDRPVERVSWNDVQGFLETINKRVDGLALALPREAQWEYACRAGASSALYTGDIAILGENNAPALDPIAWYGGNSGVDFELAEGYDSKGWKEKQYPHDKAGTHPVGFKRPNDWGLYDTLGNVWEWCADGKRDYGTEPELDPHGSLETGAGRVIRGGSWHGVARGVRAASRYWLRPDVRGSRLGFRCARVQA